MEPTSLNTQFKPRSESFLFFLIFPICSSQYHQCISLPILGKKLPFLRVIQRWEQEQSFSFIYGKPSVLGREGERTGEHSGVPVDFRLEMQLGALRPQGHELSIQKNTHHTGISKTHDWSDLHTSAVIETSSEGKIPLEHSGPLARILLFICLQTLVSPTCFPRSATSEIGPCQP